MESSYALRRKHPPGVKQLGPTPEVPTIHRRISISEGRFERVKGRKRSTGHQGHVLHRLFDHVLRRSPRLVSASLLGGALVFTTGCGATLPKQRIVSHPVQRIGAATQLSERIQAGGGGKDEIIRLAIHGDLTGLSARDAQVMIERLAKGPTLGKAEKAIVALLTALDPAERARCLRLIDGGLDRYGSGSIFGHDIDDQALRARALVLAAEAMAFIDRTELLIVSDFDDTISPHFGPPAFPGVRELYIALDEGPKGGGAHGDLHVVTARDPVFADPTHHLRRAGVEFNSIGYGNLLAEIGNGLGIKKGVFEAKLANIVTLMERNPELRTLLFGDSTFTDYDVYRAAMDRFPDRIPLSLIHRIPGKALPAWVAADPRFIVFDDYAQAARALFDRGYIDAEQLATVSGVVQAPIASN